MRVFFIQKLVMLRNYVVFLLGFLEIGMMSPELEISFSRKFAEKSYVNRQYREMEVAEIAIYHALGDLPEPEMTHRFC